MTVLPQGPFKVRLSHGPDPVMDGMVMKHSKRRQLVSSGSRSLDVSFGFQGFGAFGLRVQGL